MTKEPARRAREWRAANGYLDCPQIPLDVLGRILLRLGLTDLEVTTQELGPELAKAAIHRATTTPRRKP